MREWRTLRHHRRSANPALTQAAGKKTTAHATVSRARASSRDLGTRFTALTRPGHKGYSSAKPRRAAGGEGGSRGAQE